MSFLGLIVAQCLSALSQAAILFFIACGLTLIFGIMRIVNFAHGAIFMLGAYVGITALAVTGNFLLSLHHRSRRGGSRGNGVRAHLPAPALWSA